MWLTMGDFVKAFPRTWREDLLCLLSRVPGLTGGAFALLADILQSDDVQVWLSGNTLIIIKQGIPEGGTVLMDDSYVDACQGQAVFSQASSISNSAEAYSKAIEELGFKLSTPPHMDTSFFIGHRKGCALFLYIQPDFETPDHSLVVVRFTED